MKYFTLLGFAGLVFSGFAYSSMCRTQENMPVGTSLHCTAGARSAGPSRFHFLAGNITKGHRYSCRFGASTGSATLILTDSHFPRGVTYTTESINYRFPMQLNVDASNMAERESDVNFSYEVSPSDIPAEITARCSRIN